MAADAAPGTKLSNSRRLGFAVGEVGIGLYWHSFHYFLLFYYTDTLGLKPTLAGAIIMLGSLWDGLVDPFIGAAADRTRTRWGSYRPYLLFVPPVLGLAFLSQYYRPPIDGGALIFYVTATHFLFRSAFAAMSVPYVALSARMTRDANERSTLAGLRMMCSTLAAVFVVATTQPIVSAVTGLMPGVQGYFAVAALYVVPASIVFLIVFSLVREQPRGHGGEDASVPMREVFPALSKNRAFWTLLLGVCGLTFCATALMKTVLYYYKYALHAEGQARFALMLGVGSALVYLPLMMAVVRRVGKRAIWFGSCAAGLAGLAFLGLNDIDRPWQMCVFLVYMQFSLVGVWFGFWSMIPDAVEYGQWRTGVRVEAFIFGVVGLVGKSALGASIFALGRSLDAVGFVANQEQSEATLEGLKNIMVFMPLGGFCVILAATLFNPLRRGVHEKIVADLRAGRYHEGAPALATMPARV